MTKIGMLSYQRFSRLWFLPISLWLLWLLVLPFTASAQTDPNQVTISAQGRLQVLEVRVHEAVGQEAVVLSPVLHRGGQEHQAVFQRRIVEGLPADQHGDNDDKNGHSRSLRPADSPSYVP